VQNHLGIAVGPEMESLRFQLSTNLAMVENLPIEYDNDIFVRAEEGLVAGFEIEDA
jgi:hypothetical protein